MQNNDYKPLTIYDLIHFRLTQTYDTIAPGDKPIKVYALNDKTRSRYDKIVNTRGTYNAEDILIIDITGWLKIGKTIKGRRADKLKDFCEEYKDATMAIIVYNDTNPATQVIAAVRELLPALQMQHFSTCNNIAGRNRALWFSKNK